jgi:hypothetical protein
VYYGVDFDDLAMHRALAECVADRRQVGQEPVRRAGGYYVESYNPKESRAEKHWTIADGKEAIDLVKAITDDGKIARIRCPLDVDPGILAELIKLGVERF